MRYLSTGKPTQSDVWVAELDGKAYVVKDFAHRNWFLRATWGRFSIHAEALAYETFGNCRHLPAYYGLLDDYAFVIEYLQARSFAEFEPGTLPPRVLEEFEHAIADLHRRKVAHGDLKKLRNILVTDSGRVVLIDLGTAFWLSGLHDSFFKRLIFSFWSREDLKAIAKVKRRLFPEKLNRVDYLLEHQRVFLEQPVRTLRTLKRKLLRRYNHANGKASAEAPASQAVAQSH